MNRWYGFFSAVLFLFYSNTSGALVIINEMMLDPVGVRDSRGEWFELYNSGPDAVDLNGWTISDHGSNSHTISGSLMIESMGYLLLGRNSSSSVNGGVDLDYSYGSAISLANTADELVIEDSLGLLIDTVAYSRSLGFDMAAGRSIALLDPGLDNNQGLNWKLTDAMPANDYGLGGFGTPGGTNFQSSSANVPEPGVAGLFGIGMFVLLYVSASRRRREMMA